MDEENIKKRKPLKVLLFVSLSILIFFTFFSTILFQTRYGQELSAKYIAQYLENRFDSKVEISDAKFGFSSLILNNIKIYDHKNQVAFDIRTMVISFRKLRNTITKFHFDRLDLNHVYINARQYKGDDAFNFQYLIWNYNRTQKKGSGPSKRIVVDKVSVRNGIIDFQRANHDRSTGTMNYDDMHIEKIKFNLSDLVIKGSKITANVSNLNGFEKSGFNTSNSAFVFLVDTNIISFHNMQVNVANTKLRGNFEMHFKKWTDFGNYIEDVDMVGDFKNTRLFVDDLRYFGSFASTNQQFILINGVVTGTVDNLRSKNIDLNFSKDFNFSGSFKISGLPELSEAFFDINTRHTGISFNDIKTLLPQIEFPDYFLEAGKMKVKGRFTGFINDFVAYADLKTDFGEVNTDLNFKIPQGSIPKYTGNLVLKDFELGKFLHQEDKIGLVSVKASVDGEGLTLNDFKSKMNASAEYFTWNKYPIKNVVFDGIMAKNIFDGSMSVKDPNLDININGNIDLSKAKPVYNFSGTLKNSNLHRLNLTKDSFNLACLFEMNAKANNLDDIEGKFTILNTNIKTTGRKYLVNTTFLTSDYDNGFRTINLKSDMAEAALSGFFKLESLPTLFLNAFKVYFDSNLIKVKELAGPNDYINFSGKLVNATFINRFFKTNCIFEDNSTIKGQINPSKNIFKIAGNMPGFYFKDYYFSDLVYNLTGNQNSLVVYASSGQLSQGDSTILKNINLSAETNPDEISFNSYFYHEGYGNHLTLNGDMVLKKDSMLVWLKNSSLVVKNVKWELNTGRIHVNWSPLIRISSLDLEHGSNSIHASGNIGKGKENSLRVLVNNVDFSQAANFIPMNLSYFSGMINGQVVLYNLLKAPYFDAAFITNPLVYYGKDTLGILTLYSNHNEITNNTSVRGSLTAPDLNELMSLDGYIDFLRKKTLDLTLSVPNTELSYFQPFLSTLFSGLEGKVAGNIKFFGPINKYKVKGEASFTDASFVVDYLKTRYSFNATGYIDEKSISINPTPIYDKFHNKAMVSGKVRHDRFDHFFFDIGILGNNIYGLNTTEEDNIYFYGQAFASGKVDISGPLDDIFMKMQLISEKNSHIYLPLYDDNSFSNYNFIRFTNSKNPDNYRQNFTFSNVTVDLDLEVNQNANLELIFTPESDDIIKGTGTGNLKIQVDYLGNCSMFGSYSIDQGDYTFTALDIIKRKFTVEKGGTITWQGDPYDANLDIKAVYTVDASLDDLFPVEEQSSSMHQKIKINTILFLTGSLYSPTIKLDFEPVTGSSISQSKASNLEIDQRIKAIKSDEQELNKQVISLLVINSFLPVDFGTPDATMSQLSNVGSVISAQVSQWFSQMSSTFGAKYLKDFQLGFNYQAENKQYKREMDVLLGLSLFNDRVKLNLNYDIANLNPNMQVDYQLTGDGKLRLRLFSRSENNPIYQQNINRQGIGLFFRKDFEDWSQLFRTRKNQELN